MNNFQLIIKVFEKYPIQGIFSIILVAIPVLVWIYIFTRKESQEKGIVAITFLAGMASALILFVYQYFWEKNLNMGFFEFKPVNFQEHFQDIALVAGFGERSIVTFLLVSLSIGFIEEYLKHWVVRKADHNYFRCVDDVIELSIIAALGFAFTENIVYLFREIVVTGTLSGKYFSLFFLRSLFVVFVHILCSGIYGYYYGVGYYAGPILKEVKMEGKKFFIPELLHKIIHLKTTRIFHDEMIALGFLISVGVHGLFDFFMTVNWTLADIIPIESFERIGIHTVVLPLYLVLGFWYLSMLLDKKEDHEKFGHLTMKEAYVQ